MNLPSSLLANSPIAAMSVDGPFSDSNYAPWIIGGLILVAIIARVIAGRWDRSRIREELERSGCKLVSATWSPFGKGSFGEDSSRTYEVTYKNPEGETLYATVKTSLLTDVFWSGEGSPSRFAERKKAKNPTPSISSEDLGKDCDNCGFFLQEGYNFCPNCGKAKH